MLTARRRSVWTPTPARGVRDSGSRQSLAPGFDLEIAIRDIEPGEQITDDYGSLNIEEEFRCACGYPHCRGAIGPGDFERFSLHWDELVCSAFPLIGMVDQPLWGLVQEEAQIRSVLAGESRVPSCRVHSLGAVNGRG